MTSSFHFGSTYSWWNVFCEFFRSLTIWPFSRNGAAKDSLDEPEALEISTFHGGGALQTSHKYEDPSADEFDTPIASNSTGCEALHATGDHIAHPRIQANAEWYQESLEHADGTLLRLLHLHPGKPDDPVNGTLVCVCLREAPRYDALSYSWGNCNRWREITVDGKSGFSVTLTLLHALHRLRSATTVRPLWIDALCINQTHIVERNSQVLNMGTIFSSARSVVGWLGECDEHRLESDLQQQDNKMFLSRLARITRDQTKAWWNRVWVIQEVAMAKELVVYFGPYVLTWSEFVSMVDGKPEWSSVMSLRDIRATVRLLGSQRPVRVDEILSLSGNCYASNSLDYVFGLCGLASRDLLAQDELLPDYSVPIEWLLLRLATSVTNGVCEKARHEVEPGLGPTSRRYQLMILQNWLVQMDHLQLLRLLEESELAHCMRTTTALLFLAAQQDHHKTIRYLVETHKMSANLVANDGRSVLHWAVMSNSTRAVQTLLQFKSIKVNVKASGRTPLDWAVTLGHLDIVQLFLESSKMNDSSGQLKREVELGLRDHSEKLSMAVLRWELDDTIRRRNNNRPRGMMTPLIETARDTEDTSCSEQDTTTAKVFLSEQPPPYQSFGVAGLDTLEFGSSHNHYRQFSRARLRAVMDAL